MTRYYQPMIQRYPLDQYPEIQKLVREEFPKESPAVQNNMYTIVAQFLHTNVVAAPRSPVWYRNQNAPTWFNGKEAIRAQDLLEDRGLISIMRGRRARPGFETGFATRLES